MYTDKSKQIYELHNIGKLLFGVTEEDDNRFQYLGYQAYTP